MSIGSRKKKFAICLFEILIKCFSRERIKKLYTLLELLDYYDLNWSNSHTILHTTAYPFEYDIPSDDHSPDVLIIGGYSASGKISSMGSTISEGTDMYVFAK